MSVALIAKVCHQANKAYCEVHGDFSQKDWESAPEWQKDSAIMGVQAHIASGLTMTPESSHESWMKQKQEDGWIYGPEKSLEKKEHPCLVPYDQLPEFQKGKDALFTSIVHSLAPFIK